MKKGAVYVDEQCPVRPCVIEHGIEHCGVCGNYPCETVRKRYGLTLEDAKERLGDEFDPVEYGTYLAAYDNKTRLEIMRKLGK